MLQSTRPQLKARSNHQAFCTNPLQKQQQKKNNVVTRYNIACIQYMNVVLFVKDSWKSPARLLFPTCHKNTYKIITNIMTIWHDLLDMSRVANPGWVDPGSNTILKKTRSNAIFILNNEQCWNVNIFWCRKKIPQLNELVQNVDEIFFGFNVFFEILNSENFKPILQVRAKLI